MASVSHTTSPVVAPPAFGQPPVWAWPLAALLGFPIGGYVANLIVGAVDSVGPALAGAAWWAALSPPTWAFAWLISSYVISANIDERFTNFGASGTLLYAFVTSLLLRWLFRRRESQAPTT